MNTYVELAKLGAIGVSVVCLLLAFKSNLALNKSAKELTAAQIKQLGANGRWTMAFAAICLTLALVAEFGHRFSLPTEIGVEVIPHNLRDTAKQVSFLQAISEPVRIKIAGSEQLIGFKEGTGRITIASGGTISIDVNDLMVAILIANGERLRATGEDVGELEEAGI